MSDRGDEWIGVEVVAAELCLSKRAAWEVLRRSGVKMLNPHSARLARFRRGDWVEAREAIMRPPAPRVARVRTRPIGTDPAPSAPAATAPSVAAKLAKLRKA